MTYRETMLYSEFMDNVKHIMYEWYVDERRPALSQQQASVVLQEYRNYFRDNCDLLTEQYGQDGIDTHASQCTHFRFCLDSKHAAAVLEPNHWRGNRQRYLYAYLLRQGAIVPWESHREAESGLERF